MSLPLDKFKYLASWDSQFCDRNGHPLGGGVVKVFLAGTSTQVVTYSDYDGTKNPVDIPLSLEGRCIIIASDLNYYDAYVYDRNGVMVFSRKNISLAEGEISIEGVVTDIHSSDNSLKATYEESPDGKTRSFDVTLSDETERRLSDLEQGIDEEIHNRQTADENEAEARKTKDDDLQQQIDNMSLGDKIAEGDFIKIEDVDGGKKEINVSPTKELLFDEDSFVVEEEEDKVKIKSKPAEGSLLWKDDAEISESVIRLSTINRPILNSTSCSAEITGNKKDGSGRFFYIGRPVLAKEGLSQNLSSDFASNEISLSKEVVDKLSKIPAIKHVAEGSVARIDNVIKCSIGEVESDSSGIVTLTLVFDDGNTRYVYLPKVDYVGFRIKELENKLIQVEKYSYATTTEILVTGTPAEITWNNLHIKYNGGTQLVLHPSNSFNFMRDGYFTKTVSNGTIYNDRQNGNKLEFVVNLDLLQLTEGSFTLYNSAEDFCNFRFTLRSGGNLAADTGYLVIERLGGK